MVPPCVMGEALTPVGAIPLRPRRVDSTLGRADRIHPTMSLRLLISEHLHIEGTEADRQRNVGVGERLNLDRHFPASSTRFSTPADSTPR
jgi:hypothetical protein